MCGRYGSGLAERAAAIRSTWCRSARPRRMPICGSLNPAGPSGASLGRNYGDSHLAISIPPQAASEIRFAVMRAVADRGAPWPADRRRLGVRGEPHHAAHRERGGARSCSITPVSPKGWWAVERDGQVMSRWTDGDAAVPLPGDERRTTCWRSTWPVR